MANSKIEQSHSKSKIATYRQKIDRIDDQLLGLLLRRVSLAKKIGQFKLKAGAQLRDPLREEQILTRLSSKAQNALSHTVVRKFFSTLIDLTRELEQKSVLHNKVHHHLPKGRLVIIGLGHMGLSLWQDLSNAFASRLYGSETHAPHLRYIKKHYPKLQKFNFLDSLTSHDIVILCLPADEVLYYVKKHHASLQKAGLVMDITAVKKDYLLRLKKIYQGENYISCHPLAGAEGSGPQSARPDLFNHSTVYCMPLSSNQSSRSTALFKSFWGLFDASLLTVSPAEHDRAVAFTSHLTHLISFKLWEMTDKLQNKGHTRLVLGPSLKGMLRVSSSSAIHWQNILKENRSYLLEHLMSLKKLLKDAEKNLKAKKAPKLLQRKTI